MSNELDKQFRSAIAGYESSVNTEALWQRLQPEPKRRWPKHWLLPFLLLSTAALLFLLRGRPIDTIGNFPIALAEQDLPSISVAKSQRSHPSNNEASPRSPQPPSLGNVHHQTNIPVPAIETRPPEPVASIMKKPLSGALRRHKAIPHTPTLSPSAIAHDTVPPLDSLPKASANASSPWFFQANATVSLPVRALNPIDQAPNAWTAARKRSETVLEAVSADFTIGYRLLENVQLRSGIGYNQINIRFEQTFTSQHTETRYGIQSIVYNNDQTVDTVYGQVPYTLSVQQQRRHHNQITVWEVPILAGYNFAIGQSSVLAEAGVGLRIQRQRQGFILNGELEEQTWPNIDGYKNAFSYHLQTNLLWLHPLTSRTYLLAGISLRYDPVSYTIRNTRATERYHQIGLQLGLRQQL